MANVANVELRVVNVSCLWPNVALMWLSMASMWLHVANAELSAVNLTNLWLSMVQYGQRVPMWPTWSSEWST